MDLVNSDILHRLQSRVVSKQMFDFDKMGARPLLSILDYSDIDKLYNIASSVRYSGDIRKKLNAIREIMHQRGFKKLGQGTNRIAYSYFEDPTIVLKIATDKTGMHDNPREFINQNYLKPFCCKLFEVSPDGVVAEVERGEPITSREEYLSCASDIYDMLNIITKKYILADIGSRFFMNVAIRQGFGPILIDFPYLYVPDGNKLICCAPNNNEPSGICGGFIDYDRGFNELTCIKCGAIYRAQELAKDVEENKIIRKGRKSKMRVAVNWNGKSGVKEINLDGQMGVSGVFKPATGIIRSNPVTESVGKLRIATPVINQKKNVVVTNEDVKIVEEKKEEEQIQTKEESVTAEVSVAKADEVNKNGTFISKEVLEKVVDDSVKKKGMKVKVKNQDGTTTETAVEHRVEPQRTSNVKVKDTSNRRYKTNHESDMPRRSQIQLTAITFEQLKELDFKYTSTDLEFHKMFFRAEHESSSPSVMVDFDSIPKDKLILISGFDESNSDELKETQEALSNLRKAYENSSEEIKILKEDNITLTKDKTALVEVIKVYENEKAEKDKLIEDLRRQIEELQNKEATEEIKPEIVGAEVIAENEDKSEASEFDTDKLTFLSGSLQTIERICEILDIEVPENIPSNTVIAFNLDNDNFIEDQDGKATCVAWLNDIPIDHIAFSTNDVINNAE